jgi:hypothetical protein
MEDCKLPFLAHASYALKKRREHADRKRCVMSMNNPLADNAPTDHEDQALVMRTRSGDREALEHLIERHQGWIYNIHSACSTIPRMPRTQPRRSSSKC